MIMAMKVVIGMMMVMTENIIGVTSKQSNAFTIYNLKFKFLGFML